MCDKRFQVNSYLSVKLEESETHIYIQDTRFSGPLSLILNILVDDTDEIEGKNIIDEMEDLYFSSSEIDFLPLIFHKEFSISPWEEFWGHCSNLQVWVEHDYNTDLLASTVSFPLLKELYIRGDSQARKILKQEIIKKFLNGTFNARVFLIENNYLDLLSEEERKEMFASHRSQIYEFFTECVREEDYEDIAMEILLKFRPQQKLITRLEKIGSDLLKYRGLGDLVSFLDTRFWTVLEVNRLDKLEILNNYLKGLPREGRSYVFMTCQKEIYSLISDCLREKNLIYTTVKIAGQLLFIPEMKRKIISLLPEILPQASLNETHMLLKSIFNPIFNAPSSETSEVLPKVPSECDEAFYKKILGAFREISTNEWSDTYERLRNFQEICLIYLLRWVYPCIAPMAYPLFNKRVKQVYKNYGALIDFGLGYRLKDVFLNDKRDTSCIDTQLLYERSLFSVDMKDFSELFFGDHKAFPLAVYLDENDTSETTIILEYLPLEENEFTLSRRVKDIISKLLNQYPHKDYLWVNLLNRLDEELKACEDRVQVVYSLFLFYSTILKTSFQYKMVDIYHFTDIIVKDLKNDGFSFPIGEWDDFYAEFPVLSPDGELSAISIGSNDPKYCSHIARRFFPHEDVKITDVSRISTPSERESYREYACIFYKDLKRSQKILQSLGLEL
jgi:hypothetical protein